MSCEELCMPKVQNVLNGGLQQMGQNWLVKLKGDRAQWFSISSQNAIALGAYGGHSWEEGKY